MKYPKLSGRTNLPVNQPAPQIVYIIPESSQQHYPFQSGNTPRPLYYPSQGQSRSRNRGLDDFIYKEREYLGEIFDDFLLSTRRFCGALISWAIWRIVVPIAVIGVMIMVLA